MTCTSRTRSTIYIVFGLVCLNLGAACDSEPPPYKVEGDIAFTPQRPDLEEGREVPPYTGSNAVVLEAQTRYPTVLDVHRKIIARTCTPFDGVCHNSKEYPDLRTPSALLATIDAPCNVQSQEASAIYDRCEPYGDRFRFADGDTREIEIAYVDLIVAEEGEDEAVPTVATDAGLHIYLREAIPTDREELWGDGQFIRAFIDNDGNIKDHNFFTYGTRWFILDGGTHIVGQVRRYQTDQVNELISVGVKQGDSNRNGVFGGGNNAVPLLNPGNPEESYLIARLRGTMLDEEVPGSLMPLANQPLSIAEMLALFCFVEGLAEGPEAAQPASAIDYTACTYSADPEGLNLLGEGVTWAGRVGPILRAACGSCHGSSGTAAADLDLVNGDVYTRLLTTDSNQLEGMKLIAPGEPENSYLWLKLIDDDSIEGQPMPININGNNSLSQAQLDDINTWLVNGATNEQ